MNNLHIKLIALVTMTLDHIGVILLDPSSIFYLPLRYIGRISFVLFAFLIVEGFVYTSNKKRHLGYLALFALLCQAPEFVGYDLPSYNIFFTLSIGVLCLNILDNLTINVYIRVICTYLLIFLGSKIGVDYGSFGIALIVAIYLIKTSVASKSVRMTYSIMAYVCLNFLYSMGSIQLFGVVTFVLLYFYNGELGKKMGKMKYIFYLYYPIHIVLLEIINIILN